MYVGVSRAPLSNSTALRFRSQALSNGNIPFHMEVCIFSKVVEWYLSEILRNSDELMITAFKGSCFCFLMHLEMHCGFIRVIFWCFSENFPLWHLLFYMRFSSSRLFITFSCLTLRIFMAVCCCLLLVHFFGLLVRSLEADVWHQKRLFHYFLCSIEFQYCKFLNFEVVWKFYCSCTGDSTTHTFREA